MLINCPKCGWPVSHLPLLLDSAQCGSCGHCWNPPLLGPITPTKPASIDPPKRPHPSQEQLMSKPRWLVLADFIVSTIFKLGLLGLIAWGLWMVHRWDGVVVCKHRHLNTTYQSLLR